ncbi:hypothetical protein NDU88_009473 [Pleurodeles waltl]|uniref:Uncharacterized protein n=1 Tax=Pleurodeles waltl TaxID=8319 RepID=A0AAV7QUP6_PLEWA|nr:hypothetical protein NDU88_009473 [Pleurodeles waltl]
MERATARAAQLANNELGLVTGRPGPARTVLACADSAPADPDPSPDGRAVRRHSWRGMGLLKPRVAGLEGMEDDEEERSERRTTSERARKKIDENASEEATKDSYCCTEQTAPSEDGRRETPGILAVSTRDEVCRLREVERDLPPLQEERGNGRCVENT